MKKLIAVTASFLLAAGTVTANAACIKETKISVSDILDSVNVKAEGSDCGILKFASLLKDKYGDVSGDDLKGELLKNIIAELLEGIRHERPEETPDGETSDSEIPDADIPDTETPDVDAPDFDIPEFDFPEIIPPQTDNDIQKPDTDTDIEVDNGYQSQSSYVNEVLRLVNKYRKENGLSEVTLDSSLCKAADVRAKETVSSFSHTRPDGRSCFTVLSDLGISYGGAGENIAYGQRNAAEVMNAWMNSSGHRANILNSAFTKLGVGVYSSGNTLYWAQMFTY